jgi:diguanylate cyclase (GGDEF)-like protein
MLQRSYVDKVNKGMNLKELKACFGLTLRETEVLRGLLRGMANSAIAKNLHIAEQTVKDHLSKVYKKTGAKNRFDLVHSFMGTSDKKGASTHGKAADPERSEDAPLDISFTDELTGLYNRKGFLALMAQNLRVAKRQKNDLYMLRAKVHKSEAINNEFGRGEEECVMWEAANILKDTFRESDIIARIGGDEFAVIPLGTSPSNTGRVVARLEKKLESFNSINGRENALSVSCRVSCCLPKSKRSSSVNDLPLCSERSKYGQKKSRKLS